MKLPKEFYNGCIIFIGIALFFSIMGFTGLTHLFYLRLLNVFFIFYGVNRTIKMNLSEGKNNFVHNAVSAMATSLVGVILSIIALLIYSYSQGGDSYVQSLSETFLFGGNQTVPTYCICLLFEGVASSVIVTLLLMLYWNDRYIAD